MRRGLVVACVAVALGALAAWGCATSSPPPVGQSPSSNRDRDREPDGGWASYRPSWGTERAPTNDPGGPMSGAIVPVIPGSSSISPTVH